MKILYCLTGLERGGAETQVVELACQMAGRGHETRLVSLTPVTADWPQLREHRIPVHSLDMPRGRPGLGGWLGFIRFWRTWRPDVVHSHMFHANILARVSRPFATPARLICTAHSSHEGGRLRTWLYALTDRAADITTNVSRAAVASYVAKGAAPRHRLVWMPNGIDPARAVRPQDARARQRASLGWTAGDFGWLAAGRLAEPKDYPGLLAACVRLRQAGRTNWRLAIAGDGPLRASLERQIAALELGGVVALLGNRPDVPDLMAAADAYVMSSAWEGLPMVLLEASSAGLPIVTTDAGGNTEIVRDGETGLVVPTRSPERLAAALAAMMDLPAEARARMGAQGQNFVAAHYGMATIVDRWLAAYMDPAILAGAAGRTAI